MLINLLKALDANCTYTSADLGKRLGVTPDVVEAALTRLAEMGYLESSVTGGSAYGPEGCAGCTGCGHKDTVAWSTPVIRWYILTAKAKAMLSYA